MEVILYLILLGQAVSILLSTILIILFLRRKEKHCCPHQPKQEASRLEFEIEPSI